MTPGSAAAVTSKNTSAVSVASVASVAPGGSAGSKLARRAFWIMTRRVTVVAAGVDLALLLLFLLFDSPLLAWLNVASIALYAVAYWLLTRHHNMAALALIWLEVFGHAAVGSILVGWDSGFHYYLLMFIPAIAVSTRVPVIVVLLALLLVFYLGLHTISHATGVLTPLSVTGMWVVHAVNVAIVFAMASYTARFYYNTVRRAEHKLVELATQDPLTGLANRRNLIARAEQEIARARRSGAPIALMIADIDHFKQINDQYGHDTGDQVIHQIAQLLSGLCREQDTVSRWGGEEFLLLIPATGIEDARLLAERFRLAAEATHIEHADAKIAITLSFGVTALAVIEPLGVAIARADRAMYQSKAAGRNRVTVI